MHDILVCQNVRALYMEAQSQYWATFNFIYQGMRGNREKYIKDMF